MLVIHQQFNTWELLSDYLTQREQILLVEVLQAEHAHSFNQQNAVSSHRDSYRFRYRISATWPLPNWKLLSLILKKSAYLKWMFFIVFNPVI